MYSFIFIDDENLMRDFFRDVLDFSEYNFELSAVFSSAEKALPWLAEHPQTNAVITDIRMGNMSGLDFCEKIREYNKDILLVVLSGYKEFDYARRALRSNVFDYLSKPLMYEDLTSLFERMRQTLDKTSLAPALSEKPVAFSSMIDKIKTYMEQNYDKEVSLESVSSYVGMNASYLSRFFKQQTGSNFLDYLSSLRMQKATEYLTYPSYRLLDICYLVGYKSPNHFNKIFRQYYSCTPAEYRASCCHQR